MKKIRTAMPLTIGFMGKAIALGVTVVALTACDRNSSGGAKPEKTSPRAAPEAREQSSSKQSDQKPAENAKELTLSPEEIERGGVKIEKAIETAISESIASTGTITANQDRLVRVLPRAAGRIVRADVSLGGDVRAGQVLALVESVEVGEAHSAFLQARSEHEVTQAALRRANTLFAEQVIPEKEVLRVRADAQRAAASLQAAGAKLAMLGVNNLGSSGTANATYALTAPFPGTIIEKRAVVGELTQADQALFTVADLRNVWIDVDLSERLLSTVRPGASVSVRVAAYPDESFAGRLTYVGDTLDKTSRTAKGKVELGNPSRRLKPGMFANVALSMQATRKGIVLPANAVVLIQGLPSVFVREGDHFEAVPIEAEKLPDDRVVAKSGLKDGDEVVVAGAFALKAKLLKSQIAND